MKVTAIIVNFYTARFLPPLLEVLNKDPLVNSIIVADNSQENGLPELLKKYSKTRLIVFSQNIGFASAINQAAKNVDSEWWLVINPDTLPDNDCVEKLLTGAEKTKALIAGPRFYWDDTKLFRLPPAPGNSLWLQSAMDTSHKSIADARLYSFYWTIRHEKFWHENDIFYEPFLSGAFLLIRNDKAFFKHKNIFDERFFLYYEDTDLCLQALIKNITLICVPEAEVVHYWNQSPSENKAVLMADSHEKFFEKHYGVNYKPMTSIYHIGEELSVLKAEFDFGIVNTSPVFKFENETKPTNCFFELGINSFFVPFAQADVKGKTFQIPYQVWHKLQPGQYFGRIRNSLNKTLKIWKWEVH